MRNILVTGGAGYIGSILVNFLIKKKFNLVVIDNLCNGKKNLVHKDAKFFKLNILDKEKIHQILNSYKIDTIVHLASLINVEDSEKKPKEYFNNNYLGTKNLLLSTKNTKVKKIIFSSSCAVYAQNKNLNKKLNEKSAIKPFSVYGKLKLKTENLILKFCKKNKQKCIILRFFNVVGAKVNSKPYLGQVNNLGQLFQNISLQLLNKVSFFKIYGNTYPTKDGTCIRDFIHVRDLAEIQYLCIKLLDNNIKRKIFNCGYGQGYSVRETLKHFEKNIRKKINIKINPPRKGDVVSALCDNTKILKELKWIPRYSNLDVMVKDSFKWFKYYKKKKLINKKF